jgi:hypothetical protein
VRSTPVLSFTTYRLAHSFSFLLGEIAACGHHIEKIVVLESAKTPSSKFDLHDCDAFNAKLRNYEAIILVL